MQDDDLFDDEVKCPLNVEKNLKKKRLSKIHIRSCLKDVLSERDRNFLAPQFNKFS